MKSQRQIIIAVIRVFIIAVFSLMLSACGSSLVTIINATPNESQQTAAVVTSAPATTSPTTVTATRRPIATATDTPVDDTSTHASKAPKATAKTTRTPTAISSTVDGFQTISPPDLPPEARQTLALIDSGGPFPYSRDGIVFQNREGVLPKKSSAYYHEYTVVTPGSPDRGAKRLIAGLKGEIYYTEDHYVTFVRVIR